MPLRVASIRKRIVRFVEGFVMSPLRYIMCVNVE